MTREQAIDIVRTALQLELLEGPKPWHALMKSTSEAYLAETNDYLWKPRYHIQVLIAEGVLVEDDDGMISLAEEISD